MNSDTYSEKIKKHRVRSAYRVLIALGIIGAIVIFLWMENDRHIYTDFTVSQIYEKESVQAAKVLSFGNAVLSYDNDGAACTNLEGKDVWNTTYEMQNPMLSKSEKMVAIGDYNGRSIYVMDAQGSQGEISTNLPLRAISISDTGIVAAVLDDSDVTWIYLYRANGEELAYFKTTVSQSGYPIAVSISPSGTIVGVSYLSADGKNVKTSVAFYNFGEVGQDMVDNYMSGYDYQAVVPYLTFMTEELSFAVSDERLMFYEGAQKPVSKAEVLIEDEIKSVYHNRQYVGIVIHDRTGEAKYRLNIYNSTGELKFSTVFDTEYKNILLEDDYFCVYGDTECMFYSYSGVEKFAANMDESITLIIPGKSISNPTIVTGKKIEILKLT